MRFRKNRGLFYDIVKGMGAAPAFGLVAYQIMCFADDIEKEEK